MTTSSPSPSSLHPASAAAGGVLAAAGGLAVGELVAAPVRSWLSPVIAIADRVVDLVPQPIKQFAINVFGTADKIALIVGILTILVIAAAGIGLLARRRRTTAMGLTALFGVLGIVASLADATLSPLAALPSLVAGIVAVLAMGWLFRDHASADGGRRTALAELGWLAAGAAVLGTGGRLLARSQSADIEQQRQTVTLPDPVEPVQFPDDVSLGVDGIVPWETPNEDFYRIDTQIGVPRLSRDGWTLTVRGQVGQERQYSIDELLENFEVIERAITMTCVSNQVGGDLVGNARWLGVRVADVLQESGVDDSATQLVGRAFDGFTTGYPVERAFDRDAMLAVAMNDEPLPPEHGYPLRMVVPGLYGYVSATKWLQELELTTFEAFDQYWVERDWDRTAPIKISSRIDTPGGLSTLEGTAMIGGVAWAQPVGVATVEVQIDDGDWQEARLGAGFNDVTWRQWTYEWDTSQADSGRHTITVRATDNDGNVQIQERQEPFPNGATGWQSLVVQVA